MRLAGVIGVLFALLSLVLMSVSAANDDPCKGNPCINGNCTALSVETNGRNFSCACNAGYDGDLCDNDINDCAGDPCKNGGACTDGVNAFTCNCTAQWKGDTCETDVDECAAADLNNCHTNATCANIDGGFTCDCKPGFTGNGTSCEDVDECAVGPCKNNGVCTNKENAFQCNCTPQWTGATCEKDVDECDANTSDCHQDATCTNTDGGFNCTCDLGFSGNGTFCEDINECAPTPCKNDGTCVNKVNAFECYCTVYWKGDTCDEDVNECDGNTHNCHSDATCANTDGGFNCSCKSGFNGNGTSCTDIDECSDGTNDCHSNATCTNNDGGFKCECIKGYDGNGTFCVDINECTTNTDDCHQDAICTNTDSSFECACKSGYTGNGTHCEDVDECAEGGSNDCHADALCINIGGGFKCSCKVGFDGNGTFCAEVDECAKDTDNCHKDADCTNSVGSFTCECKFGYKGNGTYCEDIHECAANPCQNGGGCRDLIGNYSCTCEAGWTGKNCTDEVDMCTPSPCVNGGNCTNLRTTYTCKCPMKFKGENCEKEILLYDFGDTGKTSTLGGDDVFLEENTRGSFPLCGSFYEELPINVNGYIAFDDLIRQAPRLDGTGKPQFDSDKTMIAPFWSDISTGQYGKMKIQSYSEINAGFNSIKDRLKQDLNDNSFIAKFVLVVTWHKVSPSPSATYEGKEEITFQVAMVTDYMKSYAIFNYDSDMMTWKEDSDPLRTILIGYQCGGSHVHTHVATETPYLVWNETNVGKPGRFVYEVGPINDLTMCNVWYNEQKSHDVTPLLELTPACPCAKSQASADADYESVAGTDCFVTKTKSDNDTLQRCCYGSSGALLKGYPGGGYISTMLSEGNSTLDGYSKCCDGPDKGFCGRFYKLRPSDNCARYSKNGAAKPPIFNNTEITLTATVGEELTLTLAAQPGTPDGTVSYTISAPSTDDFKYTLANGVFKWTPTNTNKTFSVRFVAKDDGNNLTAVYWPKIRLCNCGSKGNCQELGTVANEDRFYHADCKCFGGYTGRRCDQDPCSGKPCYTECTLDPGTRAGYKCSKCPDGLVGDGVRCNDVNECALETDTCQQVCINTLGSYRCSCMDGYQLVADNRTCTDINECITSKPCTDPAEDCKNTPGGHECNCRPDFFRKKNKCTRATAKFTVSVAMKDGIPGQKWDEVKDKSSPAYKALVDKVIASVSAPYEAKFKDKFVGVEVLSMKQGSIVADTGIYFSEPSPDITKESVTKTLVDSAPTVGSSTSLEGLELDKPAAESLFVTADSCRLSLCDETSSDCTSHDDGSYTCVCKPGFEFYSPTMCLDLDECKDDKKCMDGVCINTPGDYLCECNTGYMFNKTSKTCKNTCDPSQCKNGKCEANYNGYFCKCNDGYAGMNCEREDKEAEYLRMVAITVGAVGAGVILLLILLLVIACCKVSYRKNSFTPNASTSLETWNPSLPRPQLMNNPQYEMKEKRKSGDAEEGHVYDEATPMASRNQGRQQGVDNQAFSETSELNGASKRRNKKNDKTDADYF